MTQLFINSGNPFLHLYNGQCTDNMQASCKTCPWPCLFLHSIFMSYALRQKPALAAPWAATVVLALTRSLHSHFPSYDTATAAALQHMLCILCSASEPNAVRVKGSHQRSLNPIPIQPCLFPTVLLLVALPSGNAVTAGDITMGA
jgi:hypothetical protein